MQILNKLLHGKPFLFAMTIFSLCVTSGCEETFDDGIVYTTQPPPVTVHLYVATTGSDTNNGEQATPFKTITKASTVAKPGAIIHVAPGTYPGGFQTKADGSVKGRITYVSDTKWGAKIVVPAGNTAKTAFDNRGHYVTIDGFEVDGTQTAGTLWTVGINVAGTGNIVTNCRVHDIYTTANGNSGGGAGILLDSWYGWNDMHAIGNLVYNIGPKAPLTGASWYQGIYQTATGSIKNNITYNVSGAGIHLWHNAKNVDIVNNTTFGNWIGIVWGGGDYVNGEKGPCDYVNVINNIVFDNWGYGLDEAGQNGTHHTIKNNLVFQNGTNFLLKVTTHSGTIAADPQFVNYIKTGGGNYHLKSTSPAVDKGLSTLAPTTDYDGIARPQGAGFDMGAFEFK